MKTTAKLSAYGLSLAVVFTGAWAVGNAVGPFGASTPTTDGHHSAQASDRGDAATTTTVTAPPPADPAQRQEQQPQRPGAHDATVMPPTPAVAASAAPAATEAVTAPRPSAQPQDQIGAQPELVAAGEPVGEPSQPHDRRREAGRHKAGQGNGADHGRIHHQQERRGEGHR